MKGITAIGLSAGIGIWILLLGFAISQMSCFALSNCGVGHLLGLKAMGLVAIVPAYVVARIISKAFNKK